MNDIAEQRPEFFEGEYLSASDLEQLVVYARDQLARHALGGHAWGIVSGLQLVEQTSSSGTLDVYLLPGYAVDGYGRAVVVVNPLRLSVNDLNGQPSGPVQVWVRYDEGTTSAVRPGFEVCNAGDSYTRVAESYVLEVGDFSTTESQSGVSVAGEAVEDARTAPRVFDDNGPVACDGSVPFQELPLADETSRWLIPLGQVGWQNGTPGQLVALTEEQKLYSRRLRRYHGVVAESVFAADGLIRLRRRTMDLPAGQTVDQDLIDEFCAADSVADPSHDNDLKLCNEKPAFNELVWIEGRLRVTDDTRILGGRLELRDAAGTNYLPTGEPGSVPLLLQRTDRDENADLEILIGTAEQGNNRLLIKQAGEPTEDSADPCGALKFDSATTRVAVLDNGNVGIGTEDPDQMLEIDGGGETFIHLKDTAVPSDLYLGAGANGGVMATMGTGDLRFRTGGTSDPTDDADTRMTIAAKGMVGIGTTDPDEDRVLTLEAEGAAYMIARITTDDTDPDAEAHEILVGANGDGAIVSANSDDDDLILGANGNQPIVWIKANGRVGVNTSGPSHDVGIKGASKAELALLADQGNRRLVIGADGTGTKVGSNTDHDLQLKTNDETRVMIKNDGKVGIGTDAPTVLLEVRGSIKLGSSGQYYAPGAPFNWQIIAGNVDAEGDEVLGSGFTCQHVSGTSTYTVTYDAPFDNRPVVTVTGTNGNTVVGGLQWPVVILSDESHFIVEFQSTAPGGPAEERFSFIVFGER